MHQHTHHDHDHHHPQVQQVNKAFMAGIILNSLFVITEFAAGLYENSMALVADAGHNLSDVISLVLAMIAFRLTKIKPNQKYTYGYKKTTIIVALFNAFILLIAIGSISWEATERLVHTKSTQGTVIAIVAGVGIAINTITALLFYRNKEKDLNIKGAYLHLMADAAVSLGVVIAGIIIIYTGWYWIDSIISYLVVIVIFISTWRLLKDTLRLSLDGVPQNVNIEAITDAAKKIKGVVQIHHIHIWAMSTTENALTAHLVVDKGLSDEEVKEIKHDFKHDLQHLNISHATLETETEHEKCDDEIC